MSRTSPRTLLLHNPLTDPLRQIYRLADSRSGTLESPTGRSLTRVSREHDNCSPFAPTCSSVPVSPVCPRTTGTVLVRVVTHSAAVVQSLEHFAHAERSGVITHQRSRLGSLIGVLPSTPIRLPSRDRWWVMTPLLSA